MLSVSPHGSRSHNHSWQPATYALFQLHAVLLLPLPIRVSYTPAFISILYKSLSIHRISHRVTNLFVQRLDPLLAFPLSHPATHRVSYGGRRISLQLLCRNATPVCHITSVHRSQILIPGMNDTAKKVTATTTLLFSGLDTQPNASRATFPRACWRPPMATPRDC